jgi:general secretion pathway protein G
VSTTPNKPSVQAPAAKTCGLAIASLVCGLVGPCTAGLASIAGLILGIMGLKKIKAGGGAVGGRGLAIAGIIVSVVTLILCLIAITGIVMSFATPMIMGQAKHARTSAVQAEIAGLQTALDAFEMDCGRYPTTEEGLKALVDQPKGRGTWHGPYVKNDVPTDPWGNPYIYRQPGQHNVNGYDLYSFGPDGQEGGADDIDNWSQR